MKQSPSQTSAVTVSIVQPLWIAKMYPGKVGRDHLGLGSVSSDQILPSVSPSINVLTHHPRYHSFYVFLLDEYWQRDRPRSRKAWKEFFRPREFIFSVGANLCDQSEHGIMGNIVGSNITAPLANQQLNRYDTTTHYIESDLGGYGLYYRSVMIELGLVYPGGQGLPYPVDVPSEKGKEVASAFREVVKNTAYYRRYFDKDVALVPIEAIREYICQACLCQLQTSKAPDRALLLDLFMRHGNISEARRETFRLFLDIAAQTQGHPIDQHAFRQLIYFGAADSGATYRPQQALLDSYRRWRLYQAREYYAFALNALWYYLCRWGLQQSGDVRPVPLSQLWQHLESSLDFNRLASQLKVVKPNIKADSSVQRLLEWIQHVVGVSAAKFDEACTITSHLHEDQLYWLAKQDPGDPTAMIAGTVAMLALVFSRFGHPDLWSQPEWVISRMGAEGRLSLDSFVREVNRRLKRGSFTVGDLARWIYSDYIILQHQLVATSKLPDNTFRFQREGDRLRFYDLENTLEFMDSRFWALSTTVHELGLCGDLSQSKHRLTPDGQRLLAQGDLR